MVRFLMFRDLAQIKPSHESMIGKLFEKNTFKAELVILARRRLFLSGSK